MILEKRVDKLEAWARDRESRRLADRLSRMTNEELLSLIGDPLGKRPEDVTIEDVYAFIYGPPENRCHGPCFHATDCQGWGHCLEVQRGAGLLVEPIDYLITIGSSGPSNFGNDIDIPVGECSNCPRLKQYPSLQGKGVAQVQHIAKVHVVIDAIEIQRVGSRQERI